MERMIKRIMLIINPRAGTGQYRTDISDILEAFSQNDAVATVYMTTHSGHATELVEAHAHKYDIVVCCGGDGTLSETIAGLMALEDRPPVGYIPMGTANDVAATLGLPKEGGKAAQIALAGRPIPLDVGLFDGEHFSYIAAFGAFTEVSYQTPTENKQTLGHLAYVLEGMGHLGKIVPRKLVVEYDGGKRVEGKFIFGGVSNTTSIAGLVKLRPELVDLGDGEFEIILVKNPRSLMALNALFMDIVTQKYDSKYVQIFRAKEARFRFEEPVPWTRDGEAGGLHREAYFQILQPGVQIMVPDEKE